jgi:RNA polymerase sigma-70 factor (ECF subfamily)
VGVAQQEVDQDVDCVARAREGDGDALGILYERYCDRVYSYAYARLGDHGAAEDVTGQVFLRIVETMRTYEWQGAGFAAWLFRIAHNQVVDSLRRRTRHAALPLDLARAIVAPLGSDPHAYAERRDFLAHLQAALGHLSDAQAQVILLKYAAGLSNTEIAGVLARSTNAVNALHYEAIRKLRKLLEKQGYAL